MIGVFKPVNNDWGYEIREVIVENGKVSIQSLPIQHYRNINDFKVFKPLKHCKNRREYKEQFVFLGY